MVRACIQAEELEPTHVIGTISGDEIVTKMMGGEGGNGGKRKRTNRAW